MILFPPGVFHSARDAHFLHNLSGLNSLIFAHSVSFGWFSHYNLTLAKKKTAVMQRSTGKNGFRRPTR